MLVACRLAGLSALGAHYAGVRARAQFGLTRACDCVNTRGTPSLPGDARAARRSASLRRQGGRAITFGQPRYDMSAGNQIVEEMDSRLRHLRLVEELDHQGQIDIEPQDVVGVDLPACAKPGDASEDRDSLHGVAVVQNREDLPHQGFAPSVIRFAQIDSNHEDVIRHPLLRLTNPKCNAPVEVVNEALGRAPSPRGSSPPRLGVAQRRRWLTVWVFPGFAPGALARPICESAVVCQPPRVATDRAGSRTTPHDR